MLLSNHFENENLAGYMKRIKKKRHTLQGAIGMRVAAQAEHREHMNRRKKYAGKQKQSLSELLNYDIPQAASLVVREFQRKPIWIIYGNTGTEYEMFSKKQNNQGIYSFFLQG